MLIEVCLNELGGVSNPSTVSLADSVTEGLADPVKVSSTRA